MIIKIPYINYHGSLVKMISMFESSTRELLLSLDADMLAVLGGNTPVDVSKGAAFRWLSAAGAAVCLLLA